MRALRLATIARWSIDGRTASASVYSMAVRGMSERRNTFWRHCAENEIPLT
jgi:hypothetical protein